MLDTIRIETKKLTAEQLLRQSFSPSVIILKIDLPISFFLEDLQEKKRPFLNELRLSEIRHNFTNYESILSDLRSSGQFTRGIYENIKAQCNSFINNIWNDHVMCLTQPDLDWQIEVANRWQQEIGRSFVEREVEFSKRWLDYEREVREEIYKPWRDNLNARLQAKGWTQQECYHHIEQILKGEVYGILARFSGEPPEFTDEERKKASLRLRANLSCVSILLP